MNSPTTGALLAQAPSDRFRSFGAFGKPAYQSHVQLRAMLKARRGERWANYFSRPTFDPDSGELRWNAEVPGQAIAWNEMSPQDQALRALDLEVLRSGLLSFVDELRQQGAGQPGSASAFASLLEQAMRVPAQGEFLYFVGDQPVIAFWGHEGQDGASIDPALRTPPVRPSQNPADTAQVAAAPSPASTSEPPARRRWPWWLWALLAALLLALLFFLLRGCDTASVLGAGPEPAPSAPDALRGASPPPSAPAGSEPDGHGLRVDPAWAASAALGGTDTVPAASAPEDPTGPQPASAPEDAASLPEGPAASGAEEPPPPPSAPDPLPPPVPPSAPGSSPPEASRAPLELPDPPPRDAKATGTPPQMDFLEGKWRAGEGLFDRQTGKPLDLGLQFGKDGKGELTVRRADGMRCSGPVQGQMKQGRLSIRGDQKIACQDGSPYGAPRIECAKELNGQTQCFGFNQDGTRYYMGIRKQ